MFMDELDRIDRHMNAPMILRKVRASAYEAFSERPDDWVESPRARRVKRILTVSEDYCGACGAAFVDRGQYLRHHRAHQQEYQRADTTGIVMWVCRRCHRHRYTFADSRAPDSCRCCGATRFWNRGPWRERAA